jgi:hypothetical protein
MKTLTKTITVLIALSLLASGLTFARDVSESGLRDVAATEAREADVAARDMEIAAREAKRQAAMAQRQAAANIRQAEIAVADAEFMAASEDAERTNLADLDLARATLSRSRWPYRSSSVSSVLVIPSAEIETKDLLTINEDVNVMSRIFEMNLQRARISTSSVNPFVSDSVSRLVTVLGTRGRTSINTESLPTGLRRAVHDESGLSALAPVSGATAGRDRARGRRGRQGLAEHER